MAKRPVATSRPRRCSGGRSRLEAVYAVPAATATVIAPVARTTPGTWNRQLGPASLCVQPGVQVWQACASCPDLSRVSLSGNRRMATTRTLGRGGDSPTSIRRPPRATIVDAVARAECAAAGCETSGRPASASWRRSCSIVSSLVCTRQQRRGWWVVATPRLAFAAARERCTTPLRHRHRVLTGNRHVGQ